MTPRAVAAGSLQHVSASQISLFSLCQRRWWFEKVAKEPVPPSDAAELGGNIHGQMQTYYEDGVIPEHPSAALLVQSGLIPARGPLIRVEEPGDFIMGVYVAGVAIRGKIDLIDLTQLEDKGGQIDIWDWKSKADLRYAKTPDELIRDVQMMIYGRYAFESYEASLVRYFHGNIRTGKTPGFKIVRSDRVTSTEVADFMDNVVAPVVSDIKICATAEQFEDTAPNWGSCYAYRKPCPFLEKCTAGQSASVFMDMLFKGEGDGEMKLSDKLQGSVVVQPSDADVTTPPVKGMFTTTIPDDYFKPPAYAPVSPPRPGLTLYINALPVKGVATITHLDQIIADASKEICAAKKVLDLRMIAYGEGKALLAAGLRKNPPTGVVVATTGELSDVAIEALLPLADVVIRGTR